MVESDEDVMKGKRGKSGSGGKGLGETDFVTVAYRPLGDLKPDPLNPRTHTPRQIRQIARSIETFGFCTPILVDAALNIIAGHGRALAAKLLGLHKVPIIRLEHLSRVQAQALRIADNRLTEIADWDKQLLARQLKELSELNLDFSLELTGFEMGEIDLFIEGLSPEAEGRDLRGDHLPAVPPGPPVSRPGDLWLLGEQRVHCGNALDPNSYEALMQDKKATMVFTDPPYNVAIAGNVSGLGAIRHREFVMGSGEMDRAEFRDFLTNACTLLARHSIEGSLHYICMDWRHLGELLEAGQQVYSELKNLCVWTKDNPGMGSLYRSQHELVFVFKHGRRAHRNNIELGRYGRQRSNVWRYAGANSFSSSTDEGNLLVLHPTVKPVALVADAIMDCTARRDVVLDGFLGSGSTIIAAERTGRRCYGMELDPHYVDATVRRWQIFTRGIARHASNDKSFNETETEGAKRHA